MPNRTTPQPCNRTLPQIRPAPSVDRMTAITQEQPAAAAGSGLARYREALPTPGAPAFAIPGAVGRMRSRWSRLLGGTALLDAGFSLEGIADELIFITGPVLVVALAAGATPVAGVLVTAALSVAGVLGLAGQRHSEPPAAPVTRTY